MDAGGVERQRNEGYLPRNEFRAWMEMGIARLSFMSKQWPEATRRYGEVIERYPQTAAAPEAVYWRGVSRYKMNDHAALGETAAALKDQYPASLWTAKASVWLR
jgi:outer membrane protein assembly factor BamD (BamD/ComL family)